MERAQYLQERSIPELKEFLEKGIFSKEEIKHIVKRRNAFESALVRRIARKSDYLRYIAYEMNLEALRRKRVERLHLSGPSSLSDYALIRKQFFIFERAVQKFKSDLGIWVQYIQLAKREGARGLAGRLCARALQLHPTAPSLYILASSYELEQLSPSAGRALLQRGIRLNPESVELWTEYVKMELSYVETLRRRWEVLGIVPKDGDVPPNVEGENESEASRREIMRGAIVRTVLENAVKALPSVPLFKSLQDLLISFPTPLRGSFLDTLHEHLAQVLPADPEARFLRATRRLTADLEGAKLVERVKEANEELVEAIKNEALAKHVGDIYAMWVQEWLTKVEESNLRRYLILSLQSVPAKVAKKSHLSPGLLSTCLLLSVSPLNPSPPSLDKVVRMARKFTSAIYHPASGSTAVWLARLEVERRVGNINGIRTSWAEARRSATGTPEDLKKLWLWGVETTLETPVEEIYGDLLQSSMRHASTALHDMILVQYLKALHPKMEASARREDLKRLFTTYRPSAGFYQLAFSCEAALDGSVRGVLEFLYERWRSGSDVEEAGLTWATWLLRDAGDGEAAGIVVRRTLGAMKDGDARDRVERRWTEALSADSEVEAEVIMA